MATYVKIRIRRDNTTNWLAANPVLALGEIGWDTTLNKLKLGDGSKHWNDLLFVNNNQENAFEGLLRKLSGIPKVGNGKLYDPIENTIDKPSPANESDIIYVRSQQEYYYYDGTEWKELPIDIGGVDAAAVNALIASFAGYSTILNAHNVAFKSDLPNFSDFAQKTEVKNDFDNLLADATSGATNKDKLKNIIETLINNKITTLLGSFTTLDDYWDNKMKQLLDDANATGTNNVEKLQSLSGGDIPSIDDIWNGYDGDPGINDKVEENYGMLGKGYSATYDTNNRLTVINYLDNYKVELTYGTGAQQMQVSKAILSKDGTPIREVTYTYDGVNLTNKTVTSLI